MGEDIKERVSQRRIEIYGVNAARLSTTSVETNNFHT